MRTVRQNWSLPVERIFLQQPSVDYALVSGGIPRSQPVDISSVGAASIHGLCEQARIGAPYAEPSATEPHYTVFPMIPGFPDPHAQVIGCLNQGNGWGSWTKHTTYSLGYHVFDQRKENVTDYYRDCPRFPAQMLKVLGLFSTRPKMHGMSKGVRDNGNTIKSTSNATSDRSRNRRQNLALSISGAQVR